MTDLEIYNLARSVISSISGDLQDGIYTRLNGKLSIVWSTVKSINASADSQKEIDQPPHHKICFHYELVRQIYRDIENYCAYLESNIDQNIFEIYFQDHTQPLELIPSSFSKEKFRKNMFISAITWVFFHELGHLQQEHGHIRNKFTKINVSSIHECNINTGKEIEGREAAISHVIEIAADFEAVTFCIAEIHRQFECKDLDAAIYIFVCGVSCVLYRFNGLKLFVKEDSPIGSHPNPLVRLSNIIPQICEFLSTSKLRHTIFTEISIQAAMTVELFWLRNNINQPKMLNNYLLIRNFNRPERSNYLKVVIETWDEIEPTIKENRRFGADIGLLRFSQKIRKELNVKKTKSYLK